MFAIIDGSDPNHTRAVSSIGAFQERDAHPCILNYTIGEVFSLVSRRLGMTATRQAQSVIARCEVLWTTAIEHSAATTMFLASGRTLSFVDCATIAVMRQRNLDTIFAFDEDFERAGLTVVPD